MTRLAWSMLIHRWPLYLGALATTALGVALVHSGVAISLEHGQGSGDTVEEIGALMGIIITLALFLSISVVSATFAFTVSERTGDLALLRLVGIRPGGLRRMVHAEAFGVGLLGGAVGYLLGIPATAVQLLMLNDIGLDLSHPPHPLWLLAADAAFGAVLGSLGSWTARGRAARVPVLAAAAGEESTDGTGGMTVTRWIIGLLAALATTVTLGVAVVQGEAVAVVALSLMTLIGASTALSQLAPMLLAPAYAAARPFLARWPLLGLAGAQGRHALRRSSSIVVPVIVLTGLVGGFQSLIDTVPEMNRSATEQAYRAQLVVDGTDLDLEQLQAIDGVQTVSLQHHLDGPAQLELDPENAPPQDPATLRYPVIAVDPEAYRATHSEPAVFGSVEQLGETRALLGSATMPVGGPEAVESITVETPEGPASFDIAGRTGLSIAVVDPVVVDASALPPQMLQGGPDQALVLTTPGTDPATLEQELAGADGVEQVRTVPGMIEAFTEENNRANSLVMRAIVGMGALFALVNVITATAVGHSQRAGALGRLRGSGMGRAQLVISVTLETVIGVGTGWLLGVLTAVATVLPLSAIAHRELGEWILSLPVALLLGLGATTLVASALTAGAVTGHLLRAPLVEAARAR